MNKQRVSFEESRDLELLVKYKSGMILCRRYEYIQEKMGKRAAIPSFPSWPAFI